MLEILLLLGMVLLAGGLRVYHLGTKSLWLGEIVYASSALFGTHGSAGQVHPPLYLFVMRLLGSLGREEWLLRLPAMLAGVAAIVALWALGRSLLGPQAGLLAAFMLALSALHLDISQEVHSYALLTTLSTVLLWSLLRAARQEMAGPKGNSGELADTTLAGRSLTKPVVAWLAVWWPFLLTALLSLYTHYYALAPVGLSILVFPCFLLAVAPGPISSLWRDPARRRALLHLVATLAVAGLLFLPQAISGLRAAAQARDGAGAVEAGWTAGTDHWFNTLGAFISGRSPWYADPLFVPTMLLLALLGLAWLFWRRPAIAVALALWIALPLLAWFAAAPSSILRDLLFILPVALLLIAAGVTAMGRAAMSIVQLLAPARPGYAAWANAAVLGLFLLAFVKGSTDPLRAVYVQPKQDWKGLAAILQSMPGPSDAIVILPNAASPLQWYYQGPGQVVEGDLAPALERLCQDNAAVYIAATTTGTPLSPADASFLQENTIEAPLKDLALYYRNCQPDAWYGAGAERLFPLTRQPGLRFPQSRRAEEQFMALATQFDQPSDAAPASPSPVVTPPTALEPAPAPTREATATPASPQLAQPAAQDLDVAAMLNAQAEAAPDDAQALVRLGAWALQQGASPGEAGATFQRAIDLDPDAWLAYGLWANSLGKAGQVAEALQILAQGLETLPNNPALLAMQASWQSAVDSPPAEDAYQAALEQGRNALRERNWQEAVDAAQQAISLSPARHEAQLLLGDAFRGSSQLTQALQAYQRATELAPTLSILHGRQAEILARLGQAQEATAAAMMALAIDQSRWENWYALGRAYATHALAEDASAVTLAPAEAARLAEIALLRAQELAPAENQAPARSLAELRAALPQPATGPTPEPVLDYASMSGQERSAARAQAQQALQAGQPAEALAIYQQLVAVDGQDRASRMGLANALAALDRDDEALAEFEAISVSWPDFPFARIRQGALLEEKGDLAGALVAYRDALRIAPANPDTHFSLAYALRRAGQPDEAIAAFEAGLALDPGREAARAALEALKSEQ